MAIDGYELLERIEGLKKVAKLPPIVEDGKYTVVIPYVILRDIIREMEEVGIKRMAHDHI